MLRAGAVGELFGGIRAPSTVGTGTRTDNDRGSKGRSSSTIRLYENGHSAATPPPRTGTASVGAQVGDRQPKAMATYCSAWGCRRTAAPASRSIR